MGHLHIVADQCEKNLMPVYNLAPLWGPNILTVDGQEASQFAQTSGEMEVFHAIGNISTLVMRMNTLRSSLNILNVLRHQMCYALFLSK